MGNGMKWRLNFYTMATEQEQVNAAVFSLACLYREGEGVVQSFKKAVELYTMAADRDMSMPW